MLTATESLNNTRQNSLLRFYGNAFNIHLSLSLQKFIKQNGSTNTCGKDSKDPKAPPSVMLMPIFFLFHERF
jgi:hypothetical protein